MGTADGAEEPIRLGGELLVRDLPERGLRIDEPLPAPFLRELLGPAASTGAVRYAAAGAGEASIEVARLDAGALPRLRIRGHLRSSVETTCVRCVEPVTLDLSVEVDARLVPETAAKPDDSRVRSAAVSDDPLAPWPDRSPSTEDLDVTPYDGVHVPLAAVLAEALLVELPTDPMCADEAACDARTAALIETANAEIRANEAAGDPRWAALKALRAGLDPDPDASGNR